MRALKPMYSLDVRLFIVNIVTDPVLINANAAILKRDANKRISA
jgi:hypothetical protein